MWLLTWHLSGFVSMAASCEGCRYIGVFTGKLNFLGLHISQCWAFVLLCSLVFAAEGSRGMGSTSRAASILSVPREIRHEIKAPIKGQGWHCHLIQHYLYSQEMMMMSPSH